MSCVLFPASYNQCKCISFLGIRSLFLKRDLACPNGREGQNCHSPRSVYLFSFKVAQFLMPVCLYEHKTEVIMHLQNFKDATVSHKKVTEFKWLIIQGQGVKFIQAMNKQFWLVNCLWFSLFSFLRSWVFQINSVFFLQTIYISRHNF